MKKIDKKLIVFEIFTIGFITWYTFHHAVAFSDLKILNYHIIQTYDN